MKKSLVLCGTVFALMMTSACGTGPGGGSAGGSSVSGPAESGSAATDPGPAESQETADCKPVAGGIPANAQEFTCLNLVSASGSDATGELSWLDTDPFTLVTLERDGELRFSSKTPCNTLMSSMDVTETQLIVGPNMAMTMMACQGPQSDYERWVATFFSAALDYTLGKDTMVLSNEHGTVTFKPAAA